MKLNVKGARGIVYAGLLIGILIALVVLPMIGLSNFHVDATVELVGILLTVAFVDVILQYARRRESAPALKAAYRGISLACHSWKVGYGDLYPGDFQEGRREGEDVWNHMLRDSRHSFSMDEWRKYLRLHNDAIVSLIHRIERVLARYANHLPADFQALADGALIQLEADRAAYTAFPALREQFDDVDSAFTERFLEVLRTLARLDREADLRGKAVP